MNNRGRPAGHNRALGYRETQVLAFTHAVFAEQGVAPSYRMICRELGIATPGEVSRIVANLERRSLLMRVGRGRVRRISVSPFTLTIGSPAIG